MHTNRKPLLLFALVLATGCGDTATPAPDSLVRETWDAVYLDGARIGYVHTTVYRATDAGRPVEKVVITSKLALIRFGNRVEQESSETTWRTPEGAVSRFEVIAGLGDSRQTTTGTVSGDKATLVLSAGGKSATQPIDWPAATRSSTGVEDSLRAAPMKAGETRRFPMFLPMFNSVVDVDLKHAGVESVELEGAAPRNLSRIEARATPPAQPAQHLDSTYWVDETGETLKLAIPALRMTAVRTTAERARAPSTQPPPDLAVASFVRPEPPLADAHRKQFIRYGVRVAEGSATQAFPAASYQAVQAAADGSVEITVVALRPDAPSPAGAAQVPPGEADRRPNPFIESDDPQIVQAAAANGGADPDPWTTAVRLEAFVKAYLEEVNFSQLFATAGEAFRSKKGDCSEHAMLLCALLRARGIPARTAVGLVYVEGAQAFGYHMWTEAYIGDRWMPLDATVGRGGISAAYLKVSDTNFDGVAPLTTLLPVTKLLGKLKIEILEAR
jgi:transglutaminase-like putative cysteine protease